MMPTDSMPGVVRSRCCSELAQVFQKVDCLALPNQAGPAPRMKDVGPIDTLFKHVVPEYHGPFNLTGVPTLSVPCGFSENNLPIALQIVGKPFDLHQLIEQTKQIVPA